MCQDVSNFLFQNMSCGTNYGFTHFEIARDQIRKILTERNTKLISTNISYRNHLVAIDSTFSDKNAEDTYIRNYFYVYSASQCLNVVTALKIILYSGAWLTSTGALLTMAKFVDDYIRDASEDIIDIIRDYLMPEKVVFTQDLIMTSTSKLRSALSKLGKSFTKTLAKYINNIFLKFIIDQFALFFSSTITTCITMFTSQDLNYTLDESKLPKVSPFVGEQYVDALKNYASDSVAKAEAANASKRNRNNRRNSHVTPAITSSNTSASVSDDDSLISPQPRPFGNVLTATPPPAAVPIENYDDIPFSTAVANSAPLETPKKPVLNDEDDI